MGEEKYVVRETGRPTHRHKTEWERERNFRQKIDRERERETERERQRDRQTDRQRDRQTDRQTDRQSRGIRVDGSSNFEDIYVNGTRRRKTGGRI